MLKEIIEPLLDWYDANARVLPWREEPRPIGYGCRRLCSSRLG